ncbi:MAG: SCO family protein [Gammaproteobacteria bacterium]|jgi:hypothetical protein|nr:SCO family protein [Gammaproteobacteria bacterium]
MTTQDGNPPRSGFWGPLQIVLIGLVFIVPVLAAFFYQPEGFVNHGELVRPARPLEPFALARADGTRFDLDAIRGRWNLVYFGAAACGAGCQAALYDMRQVRLAQGKDTHRVRNLWVLADTAAPAPGLLAEHPDLEVLSASPVALEELRAQFELPAGLPGDVPGRIYVVDPLGNLMMSYPAGADPSGMRKDLVRLLRVSKIG